MISAYFSSILLLSSFAFFSEIESKAFKSAVEYSPNLLLCSWKALSKFFLSELSTNPTFSSILLITVTRELYAFI